MPKARTEPVTERETVVRALRDVLFPPALDLIVPLPSSVSSVAAAKRAFAIGVVPVLMRGARVLRFHAVEPVAGKRRRGFSFDVAACDAVPCGHQEDIHIAGVLSDAMAVFGYHAEDDSDLSDWTMVRWRCVR